MTIKNFESIIKNINTNSIFVVDSSISKSAYVALDLSIENIELKSVDVSSSVDLGLYVDNCIKNTNGELAFGGYLETRGIYQRSEYFNKKVSKLDERNIHLGVDIWLDSGSVVLAALDSEVHSFNNNVNHGDYGPTIILKHTIDKYTFYTLYGHLSIPSIENLVIGKVFKKGEVIAKLGSSKVNGDYPPHLHFQIILDIENYTGDYPGVSSLNTLDFYKNNCPNPNLLLGLE